MDAQTTPSPDTEVQKSKTLKRHFSRRNLLIAVGLLIIAVIAGLLVWRSRRVGYTKEFTIEGWHAIASQSDEVAGITKGDPKLDKATSLSASLRKLDGAVKDQKVRLSLIPRLLNDGKTLATYGTFLSDISSFTTQVAGMSDDVAAITEEDVASAKTLATKARETTNKTEESLKYLKEPINPALFDVVGYLESLKQLSDQQKATELEAAKAKRLQTEQDALSQQLGELTMAGFMDGYVAGDATKMKRYMTDAFINDYNFSQMSTEQRRYVYPASYRVISVNKQTNGNYEAVVNVLNKYRNPDDSSVNQYTNTVTYTITYVQKSARWLINFEKGN